jgi:hypothetical protein
MTTCGQSGRAGANDRGTAQLACPELTSSLWRDPPIRRLDDITTLGSNMGQLWGQSWIRQHNNQGEQGPMIVARRS